MYVLTKINAMFRIPDFYEPFTGLFQLICGTLNRIQGLALAEFEKGRMNHGPLISAGWSCRASTPRSQRQYTHCLLVNVDNL